MCMYAHELLYTNLNRLTKILNIFKLTMEVRFKIQLRPYETEQLRKKDFRKPQRFYK